MKPLAEMPGTVASKLTTVFTDIDDTITDNGLLTEQAFSALWRARNAGLRIVLVTGRPAGWCDHFARMWPIDAVVGENGAFAFAQHDGCMQRIYAERDPNSADRLEHIGHDILAQVPGCKIATDQAYRAYDLAIDIAEEVSPLDDAQIDRVVAIFEEHGATAKVSSIHVNGWFGDFNKLSMCERASAEFWNMPLDIDHATYVGDSPNDEPMFKRFPHACGVANIKRFTSRLSCLPAYVTTAEGGAGFAELIGHLVHHQA